MRKIRLGNFIWPINPTTYSLRSANSVVEHNYPDSKFVSQELTHTGSRELSFEGEFFGVKAYDLARKLMAECERGEVVEFEHPLYPTCQVAAATLELSGEPKENYVKYTLSIKRHVPIGEKEKEYTPDPERKPSKSKPGKDYSTFTVPQGGTLFSMTKRIGGGMTVASLAIMNRDALPSISKMSPGQVLKVPFKP